MKPVQTLTICHVVIVMLFLIRDDIYFVHFRKYMNDSRIMSSLGVLLGVDLQVRDPEDMDTDETGVKDALHIGKERAQAKARSTPPHKSQETQINTGDSNLPKNVKEVQLYQLFLP